MNREQVLREFDALSPEAQEQVADFIAFLHSRTSQRVTAGQTEIEDLLSEPFVGMWQDRADLVDSTAWVRGVREREWTRPHD